MSGEHTRESCKLDDCCDLLEGDSVFARIRWQEGVVSVEQLGASLGESFFLFFLVMLLLPVLCGALAVVFVSFRAAIVDGASAGYFLGVFFAVALLPGIFVCLWLQSLIFLYRLRFKPLTGRYRLRNGILCFAITLNMSVFRISIYPVYSRGGWGYGACIRSRLGRLPLRLPFLPKNIIGSKHAALKEAQRISEWLKTVVNINGVVLDRWGKQGDIIAGQDDIR